MKFTVLCENTANQPGLIPEHGLSLYIETKRHKILFDMGQTDAFLQNARTLGIDLSQVDIAFLSHGHYDHGGGIGAFLKINDTAKIYVNENVFGAHFNGTEKYIGLDQDLRYDNRLVFVGNKLEIDDELSLFSCNERPRKYKAEPYGLGIEKNGTIEPDSFLHEQYLLIKEDEQQILVSGCSHKGVLNIMDWFSPDVFIGGFHFTKLNPETEDKIVLEASARELSSYRTMYFTGHCTGTGQYDYLKEIMGNRVEYISTGKTVTIIPKNTN